MKIQIQVEKSKLQKSVTTSLFDYFCRFVASNVTKFQQEIHKCLKKTTQSCGFKKVEKK